MTDQPVVKKKRGFASMSAERRREITSMGGKAVPPEKRPFARDRALAAEAGRKGGVNLRADKRAYSLDHALAARSGAEGGAAGSYRKRRELAKVAESEPQTAPKSD
jgi:uncharacterized protein